MASFLSLSLILGTNTSPFFILALIWSNLQRLSGGKSILQLQQGALSFLSPSPLTMTVFQISSTQIFTSIIEETKRVIVSFVDVQVVSGSRRGQQLLPFHFVVPDLRSVASISLNDEITNPRRCGNQMLQRRIRQRGGDRSGSDQAKIGESGKGERESTGRSNILFLLLCLYFHFLFLFSLISIRIVKIYLISLFIIKNL